MTESFVDFNNGIGLFMTKLNVKLQGSAPGHATVNVKCNR